MTQATLPLWGRSVIFVDWHGVLSRDLFWTSILTQPRHPLHSPLGEKLAEVFARDTPTAHEWMKGQRSSEEIISGMQLPLPQRYGHDYLSRKLRDDLRAMAINTELVEILSCFRPDAYVVLATDNMDCFADAFDRAVKGRRLRRRGIGPRRRNTRLGRSVPMGRRPHNRADEESAFAACVARCDDLLCSSSVGTLKSEDPRSFFRPWLDHHGLTFADSVLIDDRPDNCAAFAAQGGAALRWKLGTNPIDELEASLRRWFGATGRVHELSV